MDQSAYTDGQLLERLVILDTSDRPETSETNWQFIIRDSIGSTVASCAMQKTDIYFDAQYRAYLTVEEVVGLLGITSLSDYVGMTLRFEGQSLIMQGTITETGNILLE